MRILIADDERLVRVNLLSMLEELYPGEHQTVQARDGKELIEQVEKEFYDVVFLDINMPKINGLDALEVCRSKSPETRWCVLTGYSEFEYAKRSISLGVKGYLLKPPDIDELRELMEEILNEKKQKAQKRNQLFENRMSQSFALADTTGVVKQMQPVKKSAVYSLYLFFLDMGGSWEERELYVDLYENLSRYLKRTIQEEDSYALFFLQTSELCLVIEGKEYPKLQSWLPLNRKLFDRKARITSIWTTADHFTELYTNKQIILGLASVRILEEGYRMISLEELKNQPDLLRKRFLCEKLEMTTAAYLTANYALANELLQEMEHSDELKECFSSLDSRGLLAYLSAVWKSDFNGETFEELSEQCRKMIQNRTWEEKNEKNNMIEQIKEYVAANYMNDVTIAEIGRRFQISPSYISRIFREKTGEKYIDFVTGVRMEKAMELLRRGLSVKEVSERVGYMSEKHFSKTFRKHFDRLPSQII